MSSALQSAVTSILDNNYVTLVVLTAIGYDYILTFSHEIEYVWNKPWTWVSTLFVLVRYFGLCSVALYTLVGSSFLPGPAKVHSVHRCFQGEILAFFGTWAMLIFVGAADLVMILRVWALYGRSRIILGILLTLYAVELIPYVIASIILVTPNQFTMVTAQVLDFSFCVVESASPIWTEVNDSFQFALAAVMFLLVVAQFIRESFQMYRVTKQWQPSRYMNLFAREGILYFLAILLFDLVNILVFADNIPTGWRLLLMGIVESVPVFTLTPRFVLNIRELYARDLRGRWKSGDMDTKFGFASGHGHDAAGTAIVFADVGQNDAEGLEQGEEIPMGERGIRSAGSDA